MNYIIFHLILGFISKFASNNYANSSNQTMPYSPAIISVFFHNPLTTYCAQDLRKKIQTYFDSNRNSSSSNKMLFPIKHEKTNTKHQISHKMKLRQPIVGHLHILLLKSHARRNDYFFKHFLLNLFHPSLGQRKKLT